MIFELGKRIAAINCCMLPIAGTAAPCAATGAVAGCTDPGSVILFNPDSSAAISVSPAGNLLDWRRNDTRSADWEAVNFPGSSAGIVFRILLASSHSECPPHTPRNMLPASGG